MCMHQDCMCSWTETYLQPSQFTAFTAVIVFTVSIVSACHHLFKHSSVNHYDGFQSPLLFGGLWLSSRICQPWEQPLSRSWLPIVEAPGFLIHPTSI